MENQQNILTKEGKKELENELKHLTQVERPKVIEDIKEARSQGDLSENAEFDAARNLQGKIEDRISEIERILENAKVISATKSSSDKVKIGSKITVQIGNEKEVYTIVGALEADPFEGKISNVSPLGMAILNKAKGDEVTYPVEVKDQIKKVTAKILKVDN